MFSTLFGQNGQKKSVFYNFFKLVKRPRFGTIYISAIPVYNDFVRVAEVWTTGPNLSHPMIFF